MYRIGQEEIDAVARTINSKDFFKINGSGREVYHFEEEWKALTGSKYALLMTSGFGALAAALTALGVGPGDEVIVPAYTYIATALAVTAAGAVPVIVETDETLTISVFDAEKHISPHTKAIIPVHIQGFPCDMDGLRALADKYRIAIVEDACQADGGSYKGKHLGSLGDAGAYSFNYYKVLTSGEGGLFVTDDRTLYERALIYHDASAVAFFGDQLENVSQPVFGGTEFRVSDITGAILREQLKKLPALLRDLRHNLDTLSAMLDPRLAVMPSHDPQGGCPTTLALRFPTADACRAFAVRCAGRGLSLTIPIDTGKHVYANWTQIMEKRGALHPAMDPFRMAANAGLQTDYSPDMCPATLGYLARTAYVAIDPDADASSLERTARILNESAAE